MALTITGKLIRSDKTTHTAALGAEGWSVTWLPGRTLTQSQAVTAMQIAQTAGGGLEPGDRRWPQLNGWAAELSLSGPDAVVRSTEAPSADPNDGAAKAYAAAHPVLCAHADEDGRGAHWLKPGETCAQAHGRQADEVQADREAGR